MDDFSRVIQNSELLRLFVSESEKHLTCIEQTLPCLDSAAEPADTLRPVLRALHTIKSSASVLRLTQIVEFVHAIEDRLLAVYDGQHSWTVSFGEDIDAMIASLRQSISRVTDASEAMTSDIPASAADAVTAHDRRSKVEPRQPTCFAHRLRFAEPMRSAATATSTLKYPSPATRENRIVEAAASPKANREQRTVTASEARTLSTLNRWVDQLPAVHQQIQRCCQPTDDGKFNLALKWLELIHIELRQSLDKLECVSVAESWKDLPAQLQELAASCGKQAWLALEGEETRLHPKQSQVLKEAILHLLRNVVDHGIELPEQRRTLGKPDESVVRIRVSTRCERLCIELQDDGRGVDLQRVRQQALRLGLRSAAELARMSEPEITQLILEPRLSTTDRQTPLSGRGFGMDAVRTAIEALGGELNVFSTHGRGTTIRMIIPTAPSADRLRTMAG